MADKRAYFKLDVGYMTNPKVLDVLDESPAAILLHIASIGYAAQHLTDGEIPVKALLRMTGASQSDVALLYAAGLWDDGPEPTKALVHDYLLHQRSAAEVKGASEKAKRAASARWDEGVDAVSNASSMPDAMPNASESAMPREEREERERTTTKESGTDVPDAPKGLALVSDKRPDVEAVCDHFADQREALGSKRPTVTAKWRNEARLMLDRDERTSEQVHACIRWLFSSEHKDAKFWRTNIRSVPKLREEYDRLSELARQGPARPTRQQETDDLFTNAARRMGVSGGGLL